MVERKEGKKESTTPLVASYYDVSTRRDKNMLLPSMHDDETA
jgi:hypothetical protein